MSASSSVKKTTPDHCRGLDSVNREKTGKECLQEDSWYLTLFEAAPDAMFLETLDDRIVDVNEAAIRLLGYTREALLQMTVADLQAPHCRGEVGTIVRGELARSGVIEGMGQHRDGTLIPIEVRNCLITQGNRRLVLSIVRDISERKRSEEHLLRTLEATDDGIWDYNLSTGEFVYSDRWATMLGYRPGEVSGWGCFCEQGLHPDDRLALQRSFDDYVHGRSDRYEIEFRLQMRDGSYKWIYSRGKVVERDPRGGPIRLIGAHTDIDARKRAEQVQASRLRLVAFAADNSSQALLQKCLDEAEQLTESAVGFYHFLDEDQQNLSLQTWSINTGRWCCLKTADLHGRHYPVAKAGVWVDCLRRRVPVIHNDYDVLGHKRGYPAGHVTVVRELVVPVVREDRVVAILGVGNKKRPYTDDDADMVQQLADLAWETVVRKRAEEALRESEKRFRALVESAPMSILLVRGGKYIYGNPKSAQLLGYSSGKELVGKDVLQSIAPEFHDIALTRLRQAEQGVANEPQELRLLRPDGDSIWSVSTSLPVTIDGEATIIVVGNDVTDLRQAQKERTRLEEQIRQAQKLESIGRLAGGVAHDLNNLLSPILGYSEMLMEDLAAGDPRREASEQIVDAAMRAADLVRQLLAFSRKQALECKAIDFNSMLANFEKLLRRTIREHIAIKLDLADAVPVINGNIGQLEQVVMNLSVNAQDAMLNGGVLTITTGRAEELPDSLQLQETGQRSPGGFAVLKVSDTGIGIEPALLEQIFEPFFTTKATHQGTGLGLATVYGIVKQHNGEITVASEPGSGTTFTIYLPAIDAAPATDRAHPENGKTAGGSETILVVEDNVQLRDLATMILRRKGYRVLAAEHGEAALALLAYHAGPLHLLLTDVIMPGMNGREVFAQVARRFPGVKVLFMSGYIDEEVVRRGVLEQGGHFLQKPFSVQVLASRIRHILDSGHDQTGCPC